MKVSLWDLFVSSATIAFGVALMALALSGCADMPTADQDCSGRFGPAGHDYWQCMAYLDRREARMDALMSELRAIQTPNPLAYMPPTIYVNHY